MSLTLFFIDVFQHFYAEIGLITFGHINAVILNRT